MHLDFMLNQVACFHGSQILWFQMQWLFSSKQTNLSIEEEPGKGPVPRNVVIAVTNTLKSAFLVMRCTPYTTIQKPAPTKELRPAPTPAPELSQTSPDNLAAPPIQRRSSRRASKAPDRLEISCGSKTYAQAVTGTDLCSICWVQLYRIQLWHRPAADARAQCPVYQIEVIRYPIWLKQRTRKWLLTAAPSVSVRMPFFCSRLGLSRVAVKMFRDGDHNNSKL